MMGQQVVVNCKELMEIAKYLKSIDISLGKIADAKEKEVSAYDKMEEIAAKVHSGGIIHSICSISPDNSNSYGDANGDSWDSISK